MAPTRTEVVKNEEKVKPNLKKSLKIPKFEEMEIDSTETSKNNVVILKNTMKRKNEDSGNDGSEAKKMDWIKEKAKDAVIPDEKKAVLKSKFLFKESGPLIIHLCNQCKEFNGNRDTQTVSQGMVHDLIL
ncbi:unnamed protein product [Caenorhabditis brenneri]